MPEHYINPARPKIRFSLLECIAIGMGAGVVGVATMTLFEKAEQALTHRPNSEVPGKTLSRLFNLNYESSPFAINHTMHWGQGILAAGIRGLMAYNGIVGPFGSFLFMGVRLLIDQTLENATGVGTLPWTWPVNEQIIDLVHKAVFAFTTGYVADRLILGEAPNA
ncbi:hypothetical protein EDD37DRAFT_22179 [Exophiala viscosa]|uniref:DUF1440 domain-containing protein n=1 Tax=Exophiala viscosa TaxID=2486360 RepID=A0AAN6DRN8_9EURO|nr:hypothetical protein EDD36DRAFT_324684 [Exophiala viscosa]KAI1628837.1 hypothetical protein EDD37DRAFT_22179 [Exophiala viscosa]